MSKHNASDRSSAETLLAAKRFTRRAVLKAGAAAGAVTLAGPALVRNALSSSGELNIMFWSDELPDVLLKGFTDKTGIKVNFTGFGSNEELLNKMKATQGEGFDIGFNARYLLDILGQIDSELVELHLADAAAPTLIREDDRSPALYVLMPMRV